MEVHLRIFGFALCYQYGIKKITPPRHETLLVAVPPIPILPYPLSK